MSILWGTMIQKHIEILIEYISSLPSILPDVSANWLWNWIQVLMYISIILQCINYCTMVTNSYQQDNVLEGMQFVESKQMKVTMITTDEN